MHDQHMGKGGMGMMGQGMAASAAGAASK
jgi:hypothetical protein